MTEEHKLKTFFPVRFYREERMCILRSGETLYLYFDIDSFFVHPPTDHPHKRDHAQCIKKRTKSRISRYIYKYFCIKKVPWIYAITQSDQTKCLGHECAKRKYEECVLPEYVEETGQSAFDLFQLDEVDHCCDGDCCKTGCIDSIRACPDLFIDRKYHIPAIASDQHGNAGNKETGDHFISFTFLNDIITDDVSEQYFRNCRDRAHYSFRIERPSFTFIHMWHTEYALIHCCSKPAFQAEWVGRVS